MKDESPPAITAVINSVQQQSTTSKPFEGCGTHGPGRISYECAPCQQVIRDAWKRDRSYPLTRPCSKHGVGLWLSPTDGCNECVVIFTEGPWWLLPMPGAVEDIVR